MRARINWGIPAYIFSSIIFVFNLVFIYYFFIYLNPLIFAFYIPVFALDIIFYPVFLSLFFNIFKKDDYDISISKLGIGINRKMHLWDKIKSISFQTGRIVHDNTFSQGLRLPALQRIYLLEKDGKEYSAIIDIDYYLKEKRDKNNLVAAKEELFYLGKMGIISDWAEKR